MQFNTWTRVPRFLQGTWKRQDRGWFHQLRIKIWRQAFNVAVRRPGGPALNVSTAVSLTPRQPVELSTQNVDIRYPAITRLRVLNDLATATSLLFPDGKDGKIYRKRLRNLTKIEAAEAQAAAEKCALGKILLLADIIWEQRTCIYGEHSIGISVVDEQRTNRTEEL